MATRAKFGRLARAAPNLTSTIVSLANQYQRTRDSNIEDAWKNGGQFEGKQVTDSSFLDYWNKRLKDVSPDDPMHDYYHNLIYSYQFTIDESKMGLKYQQGKANDAEMSNFYASWAKKMPVDSQNYRQLMTQAAKFKASATARGIASGQKAAREAYQNRQQGTYDAHEAPYDVATGYLANYALQKGYLDTKDVQGKDYGWGKLTTTEGGNDPQNVSDMLHDLTVASNDPKSPNYDPEAAAWRDLITSAIRKYDPHFSGQFNANSLATLANNARNGAQTRANRAIAAGDKSGATAAHTAMDNYAKSSMVIRASIGGDAHGAFIEQNAAYRAQMDQVLDPGSGATPLQRTAALQRYQNWLGTTGVTSLLASFPKGSFDPSSPNYNIYAAGLLGRTQNTLNGLDGKATGKDLKDDLFGFSTTDAQKNSDAVFLATQSSSLAAAADRIAAGTDVVVKTSADGKTPDPNGQSWAVFAKNDPALQSLELVPMASPAIGVYQKKDGTVVGGVNGEVLNVIAEPVTVKVYGSVDPNSKVGLNPLKPIATESDVVGSQVTIMTPGGVPMTMYGVFQNGQKVWTTTNPFAEGGHMERDSQGNLVMAYQADPGTQKAVGDAIASGTALSKALPSFSPSAFINGNQLKFQTADGKDSTDGTPWNPAIDSQTAYNDPMSAWANSSGDSMLYSLHMGESAIQNAQRQWYSDRTNWTQDMNSQLAAGVQPDAIVDVKSRELTNQVNVDWQLGRTPEQRYTAAMGLSAWAASRGAAPGQDVTAGFQTNQTADQRAALAGQLDKWGLNSGRSPVTTLPVGRGPAPVAPPAPKMGGYLGGFKTAADLLNQPGMSLAQAGDLVYKITGGNQGQQLPQQSWQLPGDQWGGVDPNTVAGRAALVAGGGRLPGANVFKAPQTNPFWSNNQPTAPGYVQPKVTPTAAPPSTPPQTFHPPTSATMKNPFIPTNAGPNTDRRF